MRNTSIKIILQNKPNNEGLSSVALRITKNRKKKEIGLGFKCHLDEFENGQFTKKHKLHKKRNLILSEQILKALSIIDNFEANKINFTLIEFENKFIGKTKDDVFVFDFFDEIINDEIKSGKTGNARVYTDTKNSMLKFTNTRNLRFNDITVTFLEKYEVHLRERGNNDGGIAVKMRQIRALYNDALNREIAKEEFYPFKKYKISKLKGKATKRALTIDEVKKFLKINISEYPHLQNSFNYFIFSYYCRGMNFIDLMKLKWSNVQGENIFYTRSKTNRQFVIKVLDPVSKVLDYYKNIRANSKHIFPIVINENMTPTQLENRKLKTLKKFNKDLKELAKIAEINSNITSYVIRHSYATNMKFLGVSSDIISQSMGHSNVEITQSYLKDFENDILDSENKKLLNL
ncbi:site-specific integrase [Flavobacterium humi]|uniref:Site-specific integrase n=1 Tax=Flavobacterium humi TaxID=2562683 RepID=A0A4Z0L560_9FLAO|nr:site-specific integrase [Flavobacterium humi]TGD57522.1 site-specific integrase [Flavobacterium humi]